MLSYRRKLSRTLSNRIFHEKDLNSLIRKSKQTLIIPLYHAVTDVVPEHLNCLYPVKSINEFKRDLQYLCKYYEPINLEELLQIEGKDDGAYFHMTFDDGLSEVYYNVAPVLIEMGIPATIFLNTAFIDNKDLFYRYKAAILYTRTANKDVMNIKYAEKEKFDLLAEKHGISFSDYLEEKKPYLNWNQVTELHNSGFTFGAHSIDHPHYSVIPLEEQIFQTRKSLEIIHENIQQKVRTFSFPFTDDGVSINFFEELGKEVDLSFGCAGLKTDCIPNHFQRIPFEKTNLSAEQYIKREYAYFLFRKIFGKNTITRERI